MFASTNLVREVLDRIKGLERDNELIRTVLMVKEPGTVHAAQAFEGLRKQILAGAAERRSHLAQLVVMSVAVSRATSVDDLRPQVREWMEQAGVGRLDEAPAGEPARDFFEDIAGDGLDGPLEVVEPAYVDRQTGALLRLGRARRAPVPAEPPIQDAAGAAEDQKEESR